MAAAMQAEVIAALLAGRDALVVSGTGSGKSFCFQVLAGWHLSCISVLAMVAPLESL